MKVKLGLGVALLAACGGGSGQGPDQSQERARAERARSQATEAGGYVAGGETSEFSGDFGACPEIASSEPLDLDDPEVASWVALAQGHHEQTLGWRRLVLSDEVTGFAEHTSVSIDVNVLRGRDVVYGSGGSTDYEVGGCDGLRGRQIELEIALATADGAVTTTFRNWFEPAPSDLHGMVLNHHGLNPDNSGGVELSGLLELGLDPALGGTPRMWFDIEFSADSVQGSLYPGVSPEDETWPRTSWTPIEAIFPDHACGSGEHPIGLDESFADIGDTPRAYYRRVAATWEREPIPAVWKSSPYGIELSPLDVPPRTEVRLDAGEPTHACANGTTATVYASLTVKTADGRVNLTQPFRSTLYSSGVYINERTPWVPAAAFDERMGLDGVNLPNGYGSIYLQNSMEWRSARVEGSLEVSQWDAFTDRVAAYPTLEWCSGLCTYFETE
jgi:hypothetical protein